MEFDSFSSEEILKTIDFGESFLIGISIDNDALILRIEADVSGVPEQYISGTEFQFLTVTFYNPMRIDMQYKSQHVSTRLDGECQSTNPNLGGFVSVSLSGYEGRKISQGHKFCYFEADMHYGVVSVLFGSVGVTVEK